ncbi:MAG: three-Cys-motif partner protein TcmP [Rhizobiales bacterium]|nr:three-Cys-motif partner protein TcmP [Hyphomicrobiales bacterium]
MVEHSFGGPWTEIKLDAVEYYLQCYTKALKRVKFDLTYIDAFAGTGTRDIEKRVGGLFEGAPIETIKQTLAGSARRAIAVRPPFDHFVFIEKDDLRCSALAEIQPENTAIDIRIIPGEANEVLRKLVGEQPWVRKDNSNSRGVVFLDPYALHVDWETLIALASTRVFDVWYLFPIRDTIRQLAHNFEGIGPKEPMLDRLLGPEWRELYSIAPEEILKRDLFDQPVEPEMRRVVSVRQFEQWLKQRLEKEFKFVSEPLPLLTAPTRQAFSLFLGVSNPSRPAIDLAQKFVRYVNKNFGPEASHRKSGL